MHQEIANVHLNQFNCPALLQGRMDFCEWIVDIYKTKYGWKLAQAKVQWKGKKKITLISFYGGRGRGLKFEPLCSGEKLWTALNPFIMGFMVEENVE